MAFQAMPSRGAVSSQMTTALQRPGWLTFAAVVMFAVGVERVISAIHYFADSVRVADLSPGAFGGHLFLWGIWDLVISGLAFWAGSSLLRGSTSGRQATGESRRQELLDPDGLVARIVRLRTATTVDVPG